MEDRKEMLLSYVRANVVPVLVDFIFGKDLEEAVVLSSDIDREELNGHYEETEFVPPKWLEEILKNNEGKIIVIDEIDKISKEEQLKFVELLKYKKISTFELPKGCLIIVTAHEINKETINEEIFSLVAKI